MKRLFFYISLISISLFSQNVIFEIDTNKLRIGERFHATVKSYDIDSSSIFWNQIDTVFNAFELLNKPIVETFMQGDTYIYKGFLLTAFDTGSFILPSSDFLSYHDDSIKTNFITVDFLPVELDSTDKIFDIKPVKKIPFLIKELVYYIPHIILLLFLLLIWVYSVFKYQNKDPFMGYLEPEIPIDVYYLTQLTELESKKYLKTQDFKSFYTRLSAIYRGYLENRFNIPALESDTYDLKILLDSKNLNENWFNDFFRNCDIVKFAKGVPQLDISVGFLENIRTYIHQHGVSIDIDDDARAKKEALIVQEADLKREKIKRKIYGFIILITPVLIVFLIYKFIK